MALHQDHLREGEKRAAFDQRQEARNAELVAEGHADQVKLRDYTGKPTFYAQIWTSIQTVLFGFALATLVAVPLGILCGLSPAVNLGLTPIIQIFKPVSPLAWLPIVTMVVAAVYTTDEPGVLPKSFVISAITVTLCSLWPTLINTGLGVASIDRDLVNVSRVLRLSPWTKITKLVLPSALPLIFTGLRLSLGVGWMVLIAAEMLAQNPGLGKFVWDEFQNGSSDSLARIMVAVLTIGIIGFLLDRIMFAVQSAVSLTASAVSAMAILELRTSPRATADARCCATSPRHRTRPVRRHPRLLRHRQDHADEPRRRPRHPRRRRVRFQGAPVTAPRPERALVFQSYALMPWLSVAGNIGLAVDAVHKGRPRAERAALVDRYIAMVGLAHARDRKPAELSGGMRQRVSRRPGAGHGARDAADGRAALRARRADPRPPRRRDRSASGRPSAAPC